MVIVSVSLISLSKLVVANELDESTEWDVFIIINLEVVPAAVVDDEDDDDPAAEEDEDEDDEEDEADETWLWMPVR